MAFDAAQAVTPTGRGGVSIRFYIPDPEGYQEERTGTLGVQIRYSDGQVKENRFDLLARLDDDEAGQTHKANLLALENYILARIDAEVLGQ